MKTIIIITVLLLAAMSVSDVSSQTDTAKSYYVNKVKVTPGRYYEFNFFSFSPGTGKLVAVNTDRSSILVYADNNLTEYFFSDIISMKEIEPEYIINTENNSPGKKEKPLWSVSAGYTNNKMEDYYSYSYDNEYEGNKGFNLQGDMVVRFSEYFGFKADVNYIHTFGTTKEATYYDPYYYSQYKTEFGDNNILALKSGIVTGYMNDYNKINFFIYLGIGLSYTFPYETVEYYDQSYYQGYPSSYTYDEGDEMQLGFNGSLRISYRIAKKYSLFFEPAFHWWSGDTDRTINLNCGLTFHL